MRYFEQSVGSSLLIDGVRLNSASNRTLLVLIDTRLSLLSSRNLVRYFAGLSSGGVRSLVGSSPQADSCRCTKVLGNGFSGFCFGLTQRAIKANEIMHIAPLKIIQFI